MIRVPYAGGLDISTRIIRAKLEVTAAVIVGVFDENAHKPTRSPSPIDSKTCR